jgi:hypothetical protein
MKHNKIVLGIIAIVVVIGGWLLFGGSNLPLGGTVHNFPELFTGGLKIGTSNQTVFSSTGALTVGTSGTSLTQVLKGTCVLGTLGAASIDASHAATTTKSYDCPVTGVTPGDLVIASLATSTNMGAQGGWVVEGAKASSTAGYIDVVIANFTGGAAVPSATGVGSSTSYIIMR